MVHELYGLSEDEIKIIEDNLNYSIIRNIFNYKDHN